MFMEKQVGQCGWSKGNKDRIRDKIKEVFGPSYVGTCSLLQEFGLLLLMKGKANGGI